MKMKSINKLSWNEHSLIYFADNTVFTTKLSMPFSLVIENNKEKKKMNANLTNIKNIFTSFQPVNSGCCIKVTDV